MRGGSRGGKPNVFKERGRDLSELTTSATANIAGPPPTYPPLDSPAIPASVETDPHLMELLSSQRELAQWYRKSPFYHADLVQDIQASCQIERYSDRYRSSSAGASVKKSVREAMCELMPECQTELSLLFPSELWDTPAVRKQKQQALAKAPQMSQRDLLAQLDQIAATADRSLSQSKVNGGDIDGDSKEQGGADDDNIVNNEEIYDEEIEEEENDYVNTYFDNGEDDESDGEDVGAVY